MDYGKRVSHEWADAAWRRKKRKTVEKRDLLRTGRFAVVNNEDLSQLAPRPRMNQHNNDVGRHVSF